MHLLSISCLQAFIFFAASLFAALASAAGHGASGDSASETLDEIVVVANKQPRSIRDVAANVTIISSDELDSILAVSLEDLFRYTSGISHEEAGTRFGGEGINIRGVGGNRVAILIDGVPLSDQFDVGSFSNATRDFLNTGLIDRIEVLHGPASALYGSSAIGGVVATRTPDPANVAVSGRTGGDLTTTWRNVDDSLHGTGKLALAGDRAGLLLGGSLRSGSEIPSAATTTPLDFRDFTRRSGLLKLVVDDDNGSTWRIGLIHQDADVQSDLNSFLGSGRYARTTALEGDDRYRMQLVTAAWEFGAPESLVEDGVLRAYLQQSTTRQDTLDERGAAARPVSIARYFEFDQQIRGIELNLHRTLELGVQSHRLGAGIEYRERRTEEYRDGVETGIEDGNVTNVILGEVFPLRDFPRSRTREWGAFAEDSLRIGDWSLIAALRADRYELAPLPDAMYAEDYPFADPVAVTETDVTPKLALMYHHRDTADIYLQYTQGFRAPPYEDANIGLDIPVFNLRAIPNPDLQSETSEGLEFGVRWRADQLSLHAAAFYTDYSNFIESRVRVGTDPDSGRTLFQARNLRAATIRGIEAGFQWRPGGQLRNFHIDGSLHVARGENGENGEALNSVGPAEAVIGIAWQQADEQRRIRLQATATEAWDERDQSRGPLFKPPGTVVLDLYVTQRLGERTTLRAGVRNLADRTAWHWSAVRGLAADDVLVPHVAQPGRNFSISVNYDW